MKLIDGIMRRFGYEKATSCPADDGHEEDLDNLAFSLAQGERPKRRSENFGDVTSIYFRAGQMEEFVKFHAWVNAKLTLAGHEHISRNKLIWAAVVIGAEKLKSEPLLILDKTTAPFPK